MNADEKFMATRRNHDWSCIECIRSDPCDPWASLFILYCDKIFHGELFASLREGFDFFREGFDFSSAFGAAATFCPSLGEARGTFWAFSRRRGKPPAYWSKDQAIARGARLARRLRLVGDRDKSL
jgi:hypothetical protein